MSPGARGGRVLPDTIRPRGRAVRVVLFRAAEKTLDVQGERLGISVDGKEVVVLEVSVVFGILLQRDNCVGAATRRGLRRSVERSSSLERVGKRRNMVEGDVRVGTKMSTTDFQLELSVTEVGEG